jgi:hypothetical protein
LPQRVRRSVCLTKGREHDTDSYKVLTLYAQTIIVPTRKYNFIETYVIKIVMARVTLMKLSQGTK